MRIAVLGGSFNPIQIAHLALADEVLKTFSYDKIIFVPAGIPPHKEIMDSIPPEKRFRMVQLAVEDNESFAVEDYEIRHSGVSYTYDTIEYLERKYSDVLEGKIALVMGSDLFPHFHLWHRAKELSEKCDLILAGRPKDFNQQDEHTNRAVGDYAKEGESNPLENPLFRNALKLDNVLMNVSSTQIRTRIAQGRSFRYLVPKKVFEYINSEKLYMKTDWSKVIERIDAYAKKVLSRKRYEHSVRVAETSRYMCGLYALDPEKGYVAGIAHDICKEMDDSLMISLAKKDGMEISDAEREKVSLLHGRAAAVFIQEEFDVFDGDIIESISNHTLGKENLCDLGKIVYCADKIEPGRPQSTEEYRKNLFSKSLNEMTAIVVRENMEYLEKKGKKIAPQSKLFLESL